MEKECANITEVAEGPSICAPSEEAKQPTEHHASAVREEAAYGIKVWVQKPYGQALDAAKRIVGEQGFSIIFEKDVRKLFADKLDLAFPHYTILGVCNAEWAHKALELDRDIGLLLPCNIVVYEQSGGTIVEAIDPIAQLAIAGGEDLQDLARQVKAKLQDVIDHIAADL